MMIKGVEFDAVYIGSRNGLSSEWKSFAMHHNWRTVMHSVFELTVPDHFQGFNQYFSDFHPCQFLVR
jgi:hypothetical protein